MQKKLRKLLISLFGVLLCMNNVQTVLAVSGLQIVQDMIVFQGGGTGILAFMSLAQKIRGITPELKDLGVILMTPVGGAIAYGLRSQIPSTSYDVGKWLAVIFAMVSTGILAQVVFNNDEEIELEDGGIRKKRFKDHLLPGLVSGAFALVGGGFAILAAPYIANALFPTSKPLVSTMPMSASTNF